MTPREFRPPRWAFLLTALAVVLFASLGVWQLQRGHAKERLRAALSDAAAPAEVISASTEPAPERLPRRARATGAYLADRQLLQDGQSQEGRPGYHVWSPLRLTGGALLLVDRGWVPQSPPLPGLGAPLGEVTLHGYWRALPEPGLRLAGANECPSEKKFPAIVLYPTAGEIACLLGGPVISGILLLDPQAAGGFVRDWTPAGFPPERHYGYAVQWFGLAVTAVVLFVVLNLKRRA